MLGCWRCAPPSPPLGFAAVLTERRSPALATESPLECCYLVRVSGSSTLPHIAPQGHCASHEHDMQLCKAVVTIKLLCTIPHDMVDA